MSNIFCVDFLDCRVNDSTNNMTSYGTLTVDENKINNIKQILLSINNSSDTRNIDKLDSLISKVLNTRNSDNMLFKLMNVLITKHRDARNGDGNKIFGKKLFAYILNENLSFYERAMWMSIIVLVGSFKDFYEICEMEQTTEESICEISRFYLSVMMNNLRTDYCYLPEYIVSYVEGKSGLAFKWCPINKGGNLYDSLVKHYATTIPRRNGNGYMYLKNTSSSNSAANFVKKQLRKFVSSNKGRCDLLEVQMSKKGGLALLDKKNPKKVCDIINKATSGAHRLHRGKTKKGNKPNLWERCPNGYKLWLKGLEKGDPKMKRNTGGGTTSIFELMWEPLVKFSKLILYYDYQDENVTFDFVTPDIEQAFSQVREQMRDYLEDCNNIMLMLDMSGSMGTDNALALAIGFTMLFSMRNKEDPMDGVFIAFSQNPRIVKIQHNGTVKGWMRSLFNEVKKDSSICGLSTNFFKAFDAMRDLCIRYSLPLSDILVVTDMRVTDRGLFGNDGKTWVEKVTRMSEEHNKIYYVILYEKQRRSNGWSIYCIFAKPKNCENPA